MADSPTLEPEGAEPPLRPVLARQYLLTRVVLLRGLGFMYVVAFAILVRQVEPLIGSRGLLPVAPFLERVWRHFDGPAALYRLPTLFWLGSSDRTLELAAWLGLALGALVLAGVVNVPILVTLWALYLSFVHVGQIFYGYGWDILLCEAGFLAVFLAPLWRPRLLHVAEPPPVLVIVLFRWLTFRLMLGAGLIKLRGDPCWRELRCLDFHYETQPNPGPLSYYFHFMPAWTHTAGVLFNHFAEVVAPFGVFGPRKLRIAAGAVIVLFQTILILSGNLSFLNWLTILIALACFDDGVFGRLLPRVWRLRLDGLRRSLSEPSRARRIATAAIGVLVGLLSIGPVVNLLSERQHMNDSFNPFDFVNTYGAFGSIERERHEVVLAGTLDDPEDPHAVWREYEFPCKPGDIRRPPCLVTPYHYRLDWQMWFAGLSNFEREPWIVHLVYELLRGDALPKTLLAKDPFPDRPPRAIRALLYTYRFAPTHAKGQYWERELDGQYLPPVTLHYRPFLRFLDAYGWLDPPRQKPDLSRP
ncbi:MAG TPA: lipase maturation factor family protein [Polyangiaceae bacterium]|nr:lipase maturation factor family protein [Polyangiaceae bacterium]